MLFVGMKFVGVKLQNNFMLFCKCQCLNALWPSTLIPPYGKFSIYIPGGLYMNVHNGVAYNGKKKIETAQMLFDKRKLCYCYTIA
jgi:hypothetical protein